MVYLDHNATTPMLPQVAEAMTRACLEYPGNPSSVHGWGRQAREAVEQSRRQVAALVGATPEEIVFTSGGTEGDNLVIRGLFAGAAARGRRHIVTSPLEHPAVLGAVEAAVSVGQPAGATSGSAVATLLPVSARGEIALADLEAALREDTALVSLSLANHELGNIYPIAAFVALARARGALVHTDAVQAAGKMPVNFPALGVDAATISAHKLGGPKGAGAVFVRRGLDLPPLLLGGHQERERRPGTENVPAIVGFGVACAHASGAISTAAARFEALRRELLLALGAVPGVRIFGVGGELDQAWTRGRGGAEGGAGREEPRDQGLVRLPGTVMVAFPGAPGQLVSIGLDLEGICVSTGAACTSGSLEPSSVLRALGLSDEAAAEGVRISLGWTTTAAEIARLGELLPGIVARVRAAVVATSASSKGAPAPEAAVATAAARRVSA